MFSKIRLGEFSLLKVATINFKIPSSLVIKIIMDIDSCNAQQINF